MMDLELELGFCREDVGAITVADVAATVRPPPQHGLLSNTMVPITSDCDAVRSLRSKWP